MKHLRLFEEFLNEKHPGPKEYYTGLSKSTAAKRAAQIKKQTPMEDDDPAAYKKLPGDSKKTKPSQYTKKFAQMFNENASELRNQVNSLPDSFHYATHITDGDTAEKIYNTQFKFNLGTGLSGTVAITNKDNLIQLLERLAKGDSPHRGLTGLFLLAFPKSEFGEMSATKRVTLDTIENDLLDNYTEFAGGRIPVKFNYGYFKDGILYTKNDSLKEENLNDEMNEGEGGPIKKQTPMNETGKNNPFYDEELDAEEEVTVDDIEIPSQGFPGGSPEQVEKDYEITVEMNPDKTFSVTGHLSDVKAYLDDYGLSHLLDDLEMNEGESGPIKNSAIETALKNKLEKIKEKNADKYKKVTIGILRAVMRRGMGAWKTGHRPGAGQEQWGYARVNSFLTGGKTIGTTANPGPDGDLGKRAGLI